jgi:thioredoxin reductase
MTCRTQVAIVGAGPAGLSAALEIARAGGVVAVFDENMRPGGQLFKQIHKFFGSKRHGAGTRGFRLGERLLADCIENGVDIHLDATVYGVFPELTLGVMEKDKCYAVKCEKILVAAGATENPLAFPGWTLPGVMGAGAAQTMININRVLPGKRFLMIGSGNVGLVVSYQILQAGGRVLGVVEATPQIGGYLVHACKLRRRGVPFYTSHTVKQVSGNDKVEHAVIVEIDQDFNTVSGSEKILDVDVVCLAVGLTPAGEFLRMSGCKFAFMPSLGGFVPLHDNNMETTVRGIYVAGDVAGIEEASTAMEEGRLAGICISHSLGLIDSKKFRDLKAEVENRINELRTGVFGQPRSCSTREIIGRCQNGEFSFENRGHSVS